MAGGVPGTAGGGRRWQTGTGAVSGGPEGAEGLTAEWVLGFRRARRRMGQQTWAGAIRELWRSAARHKIASAVIALCVAGSLGGIVLASSGSSSGRTAKATDPVAPTFSFP